MKSANSRVAEEARKEVQRRFSHAYEVLGRSPAGAPAGVSELRAMLQEMVDEFVKVYPIYYYAEPWAHDRNVVLQRARALLSASSVSGENAPGDGGMSD